MFDFARLLTFCADAEIRRESERELPQFYIDRFSENWTVSESRFFEGKVEHVMEQ